MSRIPELCGLDALAQRELITQRQVSCVELLEEHLQWIEQVNPAVNAICTLVPDQAMDRARELDAELAAGANPGPLTGLPMAIKDLALTRDIRTTYGSPLYADHVPDHDALHVARLRAAGAVIIGKTNTPEWGAGSQTFNTLFGVTATPYDLEKTAGGSSGGAAAALAARMLPLADGSDLGGSLRNPAAFCNVVGFRPSAGRVPALERVLGWSPLSLLGPMARNVPDVGLLLSVMAGADARDPLARTDDPAVFAGPFDPLDGPLGVAFSEDLGFLPVAAAVREGFRAALATFESLGCRLSETAPDLTDAPAAFQTLRGQEFAGRFSDFYREQPEKLKDTVIWNIEQGLANTGPDVAKAAATHTAIYRRMLQFFDAQDFLVLPTTQVLPFDKTLDWVREIEGVQFENYLQWMEICVVISLTGCPAISMPCGFSADGLPIGLQIVGPPGRDLDVLRLAHAFELEAPFADREPPDLG